MAAARPAADLGVTAYGAGPDDVASLPVVAPGSAVRTALSSLRQAARTRPFWLLAGGFAICGATTNGLVGTHFIPAAHDHGMTQTTAASLLALVGLFDIAGTPSPYPAWLTPTGPTRRWLLAGYSSSLRDWAVPAGCCLSLFAATSADIARPWLCSFLFYGLYWVATVPPTVALCREYFGARGAVVFGCGLRLPPVSARRSRAHTAPAWSGTGSATTTRPGTAPAPSR
ncbi:hypothetical protein GCM10020358_64510 [Amorphoplanes nipponensis]|uniref:hypothetical protein n=1 Tax=Actinoplanes nipponensis TaxID=135950 RepID=UPI0031EEDF3A